MKIDDIIKLIEQLIKNMLEILPQTYMNGSKNLWIIKPGQQSNGRGIKMFNNIGDILSHINGAKCNMFVAQKYVEKPLII